MRSILSTCFILWVFSYGANAFKLGYNVPNICQPVNVSVCSTILPYNFTILPNYRRHHTQNAVKEYLQSEDVTKLVKTNCSSDLLFFLCILHLPICVKDFQIGPVVPCRKLCEKVQRECLPTIKKYGRDWPIDIECHKFPIYEKGVCMKSFIVHNHLKNDTNKNNVPRNRKGSCRCKTDRQRTWSINRFDNRAYDFVLMAKVIRILTTADQTREIALQKVRIYREGRVKINRKKPTIFVYPSCPCPYLKNNQYFIIMGREDLARKRLVLNRKSFVYQTKRMKNTRKLKKLKHATLRQFLMGIKNKRNKSSNKG